MSKKPNNRPAQASPQTAAASMPKPPRRPAPATPRRRIRVKRWAEDGRKWVCERLDADGQVMDRLSFPSEEEAEAAARDL